MKKVLLFFVLVAMSVVSVNAQDNLKWGVMAGMNVSKYTITGFDSRIGFHAGVKAELGLSQEASGAYMDFAALLTLKGAKVDGGSLASIKFNPYYLEVPVHVGYKYAVNDDFALFGSVGPYIAVGLFGKVKAKVDGSIADLEELDTDSASEDIFGNDGLKRFDSCNKVAKSVLAPFNVSNTATAISKPARLLYPTHSLKLSFLHPK